MIKVGLYLFWTAVFSAEVSPRSACLVEIVSTTLTPQQQPTLLLNISLIDFVYKVKALKIYYNFITNQIH